MNIIAGISTLLICATAVYITNRVIACVQELHKLPENKVDPVAVQNIIDKALKESKEPNYNDLLSAINEAYGE